jgi:uncharacterized membrane protein (UPF0127 family)
MIFNRSRTVILFALLFVLGIAFGCASEDGKNIRFAKRPLVIERTVGAAVTLNAEVARSNEERAQGLMYRKSLNDGEGMLFIFERDEILSFWMKNTLIPLSIAFIAYDGRILEIRDMKPQDLTSVRSSRSARYALEVPRGWFGRAGVGPGDKLVLSAE